VEFEGRMLEVSLGPGLLSSVYDGLQNDLTTMEDVFLKRGEYTDPLDREREWDFEPIVKVGDKVIASDWLGKVEENHQPLKIMAPFQMKGTATVKSIAKAGKYKVDDTIATLTLEDRTDLAVNGKQGGKSVLGRDSTDCELCAQEGSDDLRNDGAGAEDRVRVGTARGQLPRFAEEGRMVDVEVVVHVVEAAFAHELVLDGVVPARE